MATIATDGPTTASANGALSSFRAAEEPRFEEISAGRRRVLLVDDDQVYRDGLRLLLERRGFTVEEAADGDGGLSGALHSGPGLILSDVRMPGLDGLALCRRIKRHNLLQGTPVVLLTAWEEPEVLFEAAAAGADDCLSKRLSMEELLARIHHVLQRAAPPLGADEAPELSGRIGTLTPLGILQACHLAELTGRLLAVSGGQRVGIGFRGGEVVSADGQDHGGLAVVAAFTSWTDGVFEFTVGEPGEGTPVDGRFEWLMLEVCRQLDEQRRPPRSSRPRPT